MLILCHRICAEDILRIIGPNRFLHPILSLRAESSPGSVSVRELQNTTPEQASTERTRAGALRGLLILCRGFGCGFSTEGCGFWFGSRRGLHVNFFSPFSCPIKSMPNPHHPRFQDRRHFWNSFPSGFSVCSTLVCISAFGSPYLYAK